MPRKPILKNINKISTIKNGITLMNCFFKFNLLEKYAIYKISTKGRVTAISFDRREIIKENNAIE
jgi:hypothetical protein